MMTTQEQIAAKAAQIIAYVKRIATLDKQCGDLKKKEDRYKNRRVKKEQEIKTLQNKSAGAYDAILLALVKAEPAEHRRLAAQVDECLTTFRSSSPLNEPRMDGEQLPDVGPDVTVDSQHQDAPNSQTATTDDNQESPTTSLDGDAPGTPDENATADSPTSPTAAADDKPHPPPNRAAAGAAPSGQKSPRPGEPDEGITQKQIPFIIDLIARNPAPAKRIGITPESVRSLSRRKASWVIKELQKR